MTRSIEIFVLVSLAVVSLSHIVRASAWTAYFDLLRRHGAAGVMVNGMMALWFGALIVAFHNLWSWPAIIVTLIGWAQVLKGTLHLCIPGVGERSLGLVSTNPERKFMLAGAGMLVVTVVVAVTLFFR
jgi:hypothetical protein